MEITLNSNQQETYNFFIKTFGLRTKGNEDTIKKIILTSSKLINDMGNNQDLEHISIKESLSNCQDNIRLLYKIFEKIKPANEQELLNDTDSVYFILILYQHWCESLCYIFHEFISKSFNSYIITMDDIEKYFKKNKKGSVSLEEVKNLLKQKSKSKESIVLTDFISVFSQKYGAEFKELFKLRLIPPLRNAIAHNRINIDSKEKTIEFYYPEKHKKVKLTFGKVYDLHDTFTMIYFCIVKELSRIINT